MSFKMDNFELIFYYFQPTQGKEIFPSGNDDTERTLTLISGWLSVEPFVHNKLLTELVAM
jgi:hypothetical protein